MGAMLAKGELAAAIGAGATDSPDVRPLLPDAAAAAAAWYRQTGIYPINHTVVVKDELLQADPALARTLYQAFAAAKQQFLDRLASGQPLDKDAAAIANRRDLVGADPLPYGLAPNRAALDAIARFAYDQHILSRPLAPEELFADVSGSP
jgi:4,5-dihydroxyphthalate decarboxylase